MDKKPRLSFLENAISKSGQRLNEHAKANTSDSNVDRFQSHRKDASFHRNSLGDPPKHEINRSFGERNATALRGSSSGLHLCAGLTKEDSRRNSNHSPSFLANGKTQKMNASPCQNGQLKRRPLHPEVSGSNNNVDCDVESTSDVTNEKFVLCSNCGILSKNYNHCEACGRNLKDCKMVLKSKVKPVLTKTSEPKVFQYTACPKCGAVSKELYFCDKCRAPLPQKKVDCMIQTNAEGKICSGRADAMRLEKLSFYGKKLEVLQHGGSIQKAENTCIRTITLKRPIRKKAPTEPECLTISSDEEAVESTENSTIQEPQTGNNSLVTNNCDEIMDDQDTEKALKRRKLGLTNSGINSSEEAKDNSCSDSSVISSTTEDSTFPDGLSLPELSIKCRSYRIGSFKSTAVTPLTISSKGLTFSTTTITDDTEIVKIDIQQKDIVKLIVCFSPQLAVFFVFTTPGFGGILRSRLRMNLKSGPCYDPGSSDSSKRRIVLLPEVITESEKQIIRTMFPERLIQEVEKKAANDLLVQSVPAEVKQFVRTISSSQLAQNCPENNGNQREASVIQCPQIPTVKLMTYPPPPQTGGITITSDDYLCLEEGQFLNDVIIDFYLKYLVQNRLSDEDRQRTHIFSSFFYPRLMQRPTRKNAHTESPRLSAAENRHSRVKTWTRHVDIFDKDFIIIPINESSHWFLAVICFPYLDGPVPFNETRTPISKDETTISESESETEGGYSLSPQICSTPIKSTYPEITNPSLEMIRQYTDDINMEEESPNIAVENSPSAIKQPCILMFDSLSANGRSKIVGILRDYLQIEWDVKKKTKRSFDKDVMKGGYPIVPQQSNYSDCGIYLLQYVESFFENPIQNYKLPIKELKCWFTDEFVGQKRNKIKEIITDLQKEQTGKCLQPSSQDKASFGESSNS